MVHIGIDPVLLRLGSFVLSWHGLFLTGGIALGAWVFFLQAHRQGIARSHLTEMILWTVIVGYAGARLLQVFLYDWHTYAAQPLRILAINEGGLAVYGGLIGGALAVAIYAHWRRLPFWRLADAVAVAIPLGLIVGRVGCTIAGDVVGTPTHSAWGLVYTHPGSSVPRYLLDVPTFPAPIVMMLGNAALLALLLTLRQRVQRAGDLFLTFLIVYSAGRFVLSFWQVEPALLLDLHPTQLTALAVAALAASLLLFRLVRHPAA
jgi:phosphatidylglycerol:prolipoprotein diacylglycerol transferase